MVKVDIASPTGTKIVLVRSHPATFKRFFGRSLPWFAVPGGLVGTKPQLKARAALAEFGYAQYGKKGTVTLPDGRRISAPAYEVMTKYPHKGVGAFGGLSKEERGRIRHEAARASIEALKKAASA
jgi:hypothetical protein